MNVVDLATVPGMCAMGKNKLEVAGVTTTWQLLGKFLMLKSSNITEEEHRKAYLHCMYTDIIFRYFLLGSLNF
jgi:hypothetical protein